MNEKQNEQLEREETEWFWTRYRPARENESPIEGHALVEDRPEELPRVLYRTYTTIRRIAALGIFTKLRLTGDLPGRLVGLVRRERASCCNQGA